MQSKGVVPPAKLKVAPSTTRVYTKGSCIDPSGQDPNTAASNKCGLYVDDNTPHLVALGRIYEGSTTMPNVPLGNDMMKAGVKEVRDVDAHVPVPTEEVRLVG